MLAEFEKQKIEMDLVRRESRLTMIFGLAILASLTAYAMIAYLYRSGRPLPRAASNAWGVLNVAAIALIIAVLAVRKTIYFSRRLIRDDFTLSALLQRWRTIDIILLALAESIGIFGLVVTLMGMPFARTFHFFVAAFLLTVINMPFTFKVRDKLRMFEKYADRSLL